ncbi:MAG: hypothetical protein WCR47_01725 [Desulfoplanes sp.]
MKSFFIALFLLGLCAVNVFGFGSGNGPRGRQDGPPPEAYTACEGKNAGDTASFKSPQGDTVEGICEQHGDRLVLKPSRAGRNSSSTRQQSMGRQDGPPKEAYTACEGKNAGDTAAIETPDGNTIQGICEQQGDRLVLRPEHSPS